MTIAFIVVGAFVMNGVGDTVKSQDETRNGVHGCQMAYGQDGRAHNWRSAYPHVMMNTSKHTAHV